MFFIVNEELLVKEGVWKSVNFLPDGCWKKASLSVSLLTDSERP